MDFSEALAMVKTGIKMRRRGWPSEEFIYFVPGSVFRVSRPPLLGLFPENHVITYLSHIDIMRSDDVASSWKARDEDLLAEDWEVVDA